jgi:hypothetical protein
MYDGSVLFYFWKMAADSSFRETVYSKTLPKNGGRFFVQGNCISKTLPLNESGLLPLEANLQGSSAYSLSLI